jgi:CRISPR-associated protein Csm1
MLETFFAGYLQVKLESDFKDLYTIFSGGDDFFIVGPWNRTIDIVKETRKEFSRFTGDNPDFTFSAGIIFVSPSEPISFCAEMAEDKLKDSKEQEGKDKITLFNQTVGWNELHNILLEAKRVIEWLEKEPQLISRALAYNLREYGEMAHKSNIFNPSKRIKTNYLRFVPLLTYDIVRNLTRKGQQEAFEWSKDLLPSKDKPSGGKILPYLRIVMEYVLKHTRGGKT